MSKAYEIAKRITGDSFAGRTVATNILASEVVELTEMIAAIQALRSEACGHIPVFASAEAVQHMICGRCVDDIVNRRALLFPVRILMIPKDDESS